MGCFFACFSTSKHRKRRHLVNAVSPKIQRNEATEAIQSASSTEQGEVPKPYNPSEASSNLWRPKLDQLLNCDGKKVTFDLNAKTHEELPTSDGIKSLVPDLPTSNAVLSKPQNNRYQNIAESDDEYEDLGLEKTESDDDKDKNLAIEESSESLFSLSIESRKQVFEAELDDKEVNSPMPNGKSLKEELKPIGCYRNARAFDDQEVNSSMPESVFSLSIKSRKQVCEGELDDGKEVNSPILIGKSPNEEHKPTGCNPNARDRSQYVHSVLNPVENLAQWKAVKAKASMTMSHQEKENIYSKQEINVLFSPELAVELKNRSPKPSSKDKEIAVDTSLSSWLVESETTPFSKASSGSVGNSPSKISNSGRSHEDRPILGALTMEELKQHSASTTPRRARSRSPDETPIIGTVGSYWSRTGQTVGSDPSTRTPKTRSRNIEKDDRVKSNATPFEARLERAWEGVTADV